MCSPTPTPTTLKAAEVTEELIAEFYPRAYALQHHMHEFYQQQVTEWFTPGNPGASGERFPTCMHGTPRAESCDLCADTMTMEQSARDVATYRAEQYIVRVNLGLVLIENDAPESAINATTEWAADYFQKHTKA